MARSWVESAPGTYTWLAALGATTCVVAVLPGNLKEQLLTALSTNVDNLAEHPVRVLTASAFVTDTPNWLHYAWQYSAIHAPAEHWLGTARWLTVVAAGHVGGTLLSQGLVAAGIRVGLLDASKKDVVDVGVSYGLAAVTGVTVYRLDKRWRLAGAASGLLLFGFPLATKRMFTDVGHLAAFSLGLACGGLAKGRPTWDPVAGARGWARRLHLLRPASVA